MLASDGLVNELKQHCSFKSSGNNGFFWRMYPRSGFGGGCRSVFPREKKEYTPPPWHPSSLGLSPDPEVGEQKSYGVYHFPGKTRERVDTVGPERRVYTRPRKRKKGASTVVVYTFSSLFLVQGNIRQNHPFENHPFWNPR